MRTHGLLPATSGEHGGTVAAAAGGELTCTAATAKRCGSKQGVAAAAGS